MLSTRTLQWPLFKYCGINNYSLSSLAQRKLWSAPAASFNDPFEFRVQRGPSRQGLDKFRNEHPELAAYSDEQLADHVSASFQEEIRRFGVVCLSTRADSILMWSHYAEHHRGMCLGFAGDDAPDPGRIHQVRYSDKYPEPAFDRIWHADGMASILTTKHTGWAYEEEYRMINTTAHMHIDYPGPLTQIIFGLRTTTADQILIRRVVGDDPSITFHQVEQSADSYALTLRSL